MPLKCGKVCNCQHCVRGSVRGSMRVEPRTEPRSKVRAAFKLFFVKHKEIFLTFFFVKHKEIFLNLDSLFSNMRGSEPRT